LFLGGGGWRGEVPFAVKGIGMQREGQMETVEPPKRKEEGWGHRRPGNNKGLSPKKREETPVSPDPWTRRGFVSPSGTRRTKNSCGGGKDGAEVPGLQKRRAQGARQTRGNANIGSKRRERKVGVYRVANN